MKSVLRVLLFAIIGIPMLAFAIANRHFVPVGIDPFAVDNTDTALSVPLFLIVFATLILGVLLGGMATWFGQGKHRRAARLAKADAAQLRAAKLESSDNKS